MGHVFPFIRIPLIKLVSTKSGDVWFYTSIPNSKEIEPQV